MQLQKQADGHKQAAMIEKASLLDKARLVSLASKEAFTAVPFDDFAMRPQSFRRALRFALGLAPFEQGTCICGEQLDKFTLHHVTCSTGPERTHRHNLLVKHLAKSLRAAGMHAEVEARECFISEDNAGSKRPADVLSRDLDATAPHGTALDFGVTHPQIRGSLARAATTQGSAAEKYAAIKVAKSRADCRARGYAFVPLCCETFE